MEQPAQAMTAEVAHHRAAFALGEGLDGVADVAGEGAGADHVDARASGTHRSPRSGVRRAALISPTGYMRLESPCQPSTISVTSMLTMSPSLQRLVAGNAVADHVVDRGADGLGKAAIVERGRHRAVLGGESQHRLVQFLGGHARLHHAAPACPAPAAASCPALRMPCEVGLAVQLDLPVIGQRRGRGIDISGLHKHYTRKFRSLRQDGCRGPR